jgi:outer membrane protein insertion porin family
VNFRPFASQLVVVFISFFVVAGFTPSRAQAQNINQIKTVGLKRIERDAILEKITAKPGQAFSAEGVRSDIEALYGMGYFDEIEFRKEAAGGGIDLVIEFKERPVVNDVTFEGNEKVTTSDLEEVIKVKKWSILDINKIQQDVDLIQKHYEEKGFYLAKVSYEVRPSSDGEVKLVYKVADYSKVEIKHITFLNNKAFSDDKLRGVFAETKVGDSVSLLSSSGTFKEASFKIDLQRLQYFYLENGYLKFRFETPVVTISDDKKYVYISVFVDEGVPYTIAGYDFGGDLLFSKEELKKEVKMLEGQTFSITGRNADILRLTEKYQDLGYAFTNVIPQMEFNDEARTVSLNYGFEKGSLVYFGEIRVLGNTKTYDKVVRRELRVYEGELFSGSKLRISKERVERLGFFAPGEVQFNQVPRRGRDDLLDIEIGIKERSTGTVTVGAGYSSVQGFFFQGRIGEINLLGRGQNLSFETQWGKEETVRSFSLEFMDPYAFDTDWSAGFSLFMTNAPIPDRYLTRRSGFNLKLGYPISDYTQAFLTYKFEHLRILQNYATDRARLNNQILNDGNPANDSSVLPALVVDEEPDKGILSSVVLSVVRDKRNNRFETSDGDYQNASLEIAGLGGVKNFAKFVFNNRYYNNFLGNFVFKNSTELGAMINTGGRGIPPAEKFYLGGPWNMRGYDAFSLAPTIMRPGGIEKIGGASEFYSLFELEHPLIREAGIKLVLFYDIGNAFRSVPLFDPNQSFELRQNWGFGIRWFSPLGPLRFEWGFPVGRRTIPTTGQLEASPAFIFFIGQPF